MKKRIHARAKRGFALLLLSLTTLNSCGIGGPLDFVRRGEGHTRQHSSSDPAFSSYIKTFENEARVKLNRPSFEVGDVPVNFGDTENPEYVGVCFTYSSGKGEVIIDRSWWNSADEKARQAMIFHELGHCRLDRGHYDETFDDGTREIRLSMMHSRMVYLNDYHEMEDEYHNELFTQRSQEVLARLQRDSDGEHGHSQ